METIKENKGLKVDLKKKANVKVNKQKAIQELSKIINKNMTRKYLEIYLK